MVATAGQITLSPQTVTVDSLEQARQIKVLLDDQPVPAADIKRIAAGVFKDGTAVPESKAGGTHFSDYSYMFTFAVGADGVITITPVESTLQIGKYDLYVYTAHGTAKGVIDANLDTVAQPAPRQQRTRPVISIDLEMPQYIQGQTVFIDLGPDEARHYTWYLDGEVHASGQGASRFSAKPEAGTHEVSFIARNAEGQVVSEGSGVVEVAEPPANLKPAKKKRRR